MTVSVSFEDPTAAVPVVDRWATHDLVKRMWDKDGTVWFDPVPPEVENRLGWLDLPQSSRALIDPISTLATDARAAGITDVVLCGMGGSSLAPEVFAATFDRPTEAPRLTVADTTHPAAIAAIADRIDPSTTWFVVSSKSGGTLETMSLFHFFWDRAAAVIDVPGEHFIAITDPGSSLARLGDERGFRSVVLADPNVGGRYSALSAFGLVPAGLIGVDVERLLDAADAAAALCAPGVAPEANPGVRLGGLLGTAATSGRGVVRFVADEPAQALPIWVEQLIAESTGKDHVGILPVADGACGGAGFVTIHVGSGSDETSHASISFADPYDIAGAMFILEFATAVAGEVLGINPFDQPDVQLAKTLAHDAMAGALERSGPEPMAADDPAVVDWLEARIRPDAAYTAIQAYLPPSDETSRQLEHLAEALAERSEGCVTIGYGPRFLHSTGQLHKGGQPGGVFIQLVAKASDVVPVPGAGYSFNDLIAAQAAGDGAALADRTREVVAIDVGDDPLAAIGEIIGRLRAG